MFDWKTMCVPTETTFDMVASGMGMSSDNVLGQVRPCLRLMTHDILERRASGV